MQRRYGKQVHVMLSGEQSALGRGARLEVTMNPSVRPLDSEGSRAKKAAYACPYDGYKLQRRLHEPLYVAHSMITVPAT